MTLIEEKRRQRFELLKSIYTHADGQTGKIVMLYKIGDELGWDRDKTDAVFDYLKGKGLVHHKASGGCIQIKHNGVKEIEHTLDQRQESTTDPPQANQTINVSGDEVGRDKIGRSKFDVRDIANSENVHIGDNRYTFEAENPKNILAVEKVRQKRETLAEVNNRLSEFHESAAIYWVTSYQECENRLKGEDNDKNKEKQIKAKQSLDNQLLRMASTKSKLNLLSEHKIIEDINWYIGSVGGFYAEIEAGLEMNIIPDLEWIKGCSSQQNSLLQKVFDDLGTAYNKDSE